MVKRHSSVRKPGEQSWALFFRSKPDARKTMIVKLSDQLQANRHVEARRSIKLETKRYLARHLETSNSDASVFGRLLDLSLDFELT